MNIKINGESRDFSPASLKVVELLQVLDIDAEQGGIAIALNMSVVPRGKWEETEIQEGDELEIITARQGG